VNSGPEREGVKAIKMEGTTVHEIARGGGTTYNIMWQ
jgi:hypothetical protein